MREFITVLLLLFTVTAAKAQEKNTINGSFAGLANEKVYLMRVSGENRSLVDTTHTDQTGAFTFELVPTDNPIGMYITIYGPGKAVELIYNNEDITFTTTGFSGQDDIQIISSVENLIYFDYLFLKGQNLYKMDLLLPLVKEYPNEDPFYKLITGQYKQLKKQLDERVENIITEYPNTLAAKYIKTDQPVITPLNLSEEQENNYLKQHYFDQVDFNDTLLINSSFLTSKVVQYLSLYQFNAESQEALEDNLLIAVDTVLNKARNSQPTYEFMVDFLIKGFEGIGFERGLEHIANSSRLDEFCENTERKEKLGNKLEFIRKLALGQKAPSFSTTDLEGNKLTLDSIQAKTTVLVFWASWCPHCDEILPILQSFYDETNRQEFDVITVSVDESEEELRQAINKGGYMWHNVGELDGWEGAVVNKYGIVATPTLFILDKDKTILSKPLGKDKLTNDLKALLDK